MGRIRLTGATSGYTELRAANAAGNNTIILPTTNGGEVIVSDSSGNVNIDSGTFYVDASNNRVGVGTSSPSQKLVVNGASGSNAIQIENSDDSNRGGRLSATGSAANGTFLINSTSSGYGISLGIDGTSALSIDTARRVGVGTTSPGASLHVAGAIASAPTGSGLLAGINGNYGQAKLYGTTGGILDFGASGADANARLLVNNSDNALQFYTNNGGSLSERLRIDSSGRVGIGTSAPGYLLSAVSSDTSAATYVGQFLSSANPSGTSVSYLRLEKGGGFGGAIGGYLEQGVGSGLKLSTLNGGTLSEAVTITNAGRVGIGTTSAQAQLHVQNLGGNSESILGQYGTGVQAKIGAYADGIVIDAANGPTSGAQQLRFNVNGSEAGRFDSSRRLLVGTSSARSNFFNTSFTPDVQLERNSAIAAASLVRNSADDGDPNLILGKSRGTSLGANTVVSANDNLGLISFQGADGSELVEAASIRAAVDGTPGANDMPGRLVFSTTADGASSPTERMRIKNDGTIQMGAAAGVGPSAQSGIQIGAGQLSSDIYIQHASGSSSGNYYVAFSFNGGVIGSITQSGTTAVAYNTSSDYRLKENVAPVTDGIARLRQLKPSRFNFIADPNTVVDGFIAHEVQTVVPEAITGVKDAINEDGKPIYQGIDQSKLVPLLTAALQEAVAKIESLEARLTAAGI